jgi:pimeloyl-ACP methyl ester carboxylesterase
MTDESQTVKGYVRDTNTTYPVYGATERESQELLAGGDRVVNRSGGAAGRYLARWPVAQRGRYKSPRGVVLTMKLRHVAGAAVGGLGLAAAANRVLTDAAGEYEPVLDADHGTFRWRGFDVAYAEAGDPEDPDVLLLHGVHAAASNKEFERLVEHLSADHHVIAPDLPGFGGSDRPPLVYSASLYEAFLTEFARETTEDAVCVASSLSGAYAASVQAEAELFSRLVLVCPLADTGPRTAWLRTLVRAPVVGSALFNALTAKPSLRYFAGEEAYYHAARFTEADVDDFWRTAHQPGARFAPASFVSGYLDTDDDLGALLAGLDVPVTLVWGRQAPYPEIDEGRELAERADARLVVVERAKLLPHAEHPETFLESLDEELAVGTE